jgi:LacI family transcriptional regulator
LYNKKGIAQFPSTDAGHERKESTKLKKKATIRDIAKIANVSETTVSLSFMENSRISKTTREKVKRVAEELNYVPNLAAQKLRYGVTKTLGFLVTDISSPFYARMVKGAQEVAATYGYQILIEDSDWEPDKEKWIITNMISNQVQGLILCLCEKTEESYRLIKNSNIPHIAIDTFPAFYKGAYVINDLYTSGYIAARHLIATGCRNPSFFDASPSMMAFSAFESLKQGFLDYLRENEISIGENTIVQAGWTIEEGKEAFNNFYVSERRIDGIFCVNDLCCLGVMEAAEKKGLLVGNDLALIGVDNLEVSSVSRISLTSIHQPYEEIIRLATLSLINSIKKKNHPRIRETLPSQLIERDSTKRFRLSRLEKAEKLKKV